MTRNFRDMHEFFSLTLIKFAINYSVNSPLHVYFFFNFAHPNTPPLKITFPIVSSLIIGSCFFTEAH